MKAMLFSLRNGEFARRGQPGGLFLSLAEVGWLTKVAGTAA